MIRTGLVHAFRNIAGSGHNHAVAVGVMHNEHTPFRAVFHSIFHPVGHA